MRLRVPHPFAVLVGCILLAAAATWILPAGRYQRHHDDVTGRDVVVPGTYARVEAAPVGPFRALVAIPRGIGAAADVIAFVFLVGGAFAVVEQTGALRRALTRIIRAAGGRGALVVPIVCLAFAAGGALENMQEEIIAFVPLLLLLVRGLGFDALTACAMSVGAAAVGSSFSPINPFQVIIAQKVAQLPPGSGSVFRLVFMAIALALWIAGTLYYARRNRLPAEPLALEHEHEVRGWRLDLILVMMLGALAMLPIGLNMLGWGFDELSAVFFIMGVVAGLLAGMGISGTSEAFGEGFRQMAVAALVIGFAKAISVVLDQGLVLDTIVHGLVTPLTGLPPTASAIAMQGVQALIHVPVPSVSSQAVLTMPILVPASDLLGISRQVTVLAYQYGAGLCEIVTPTNGALMAIIAAAGVPYEKWIKFALPMWGVLMVLGAGAILVAG
ncbi:MAG TPA: SLC13 family permease [Gemmatimonadales bacterium]|nr:SLC13 family permease [Gemmatimonadales bacterium]